MTIIITMKKTMTITISWYSHPLGTDALGNDVDYHDENDNEENVFLTFYEQKQLDRGPADIDSENDFPINLDCNGLYGLPNLNRNPS